MYSTIRYIIPKNWFDGINEYSNGGIANYINFNNSQFISEENNTLKKDINIKNIILVVYETMDKIIKYFDVDYAIKINIYFENLIDLDEAVIYKLPAQIDEGLKIKKSFIAVQFMKYPEFCIKGLNNKDEPDGKIYQNSNEKIINLNPKKIKSNSTRKICSLQNYVNYQEPGESTDNKTHNQLLNKSDLKYAYNNELDTSKREKFSDTKKDIDFHTLNNKKYRRNSAKNVLKKKLFPGTIGEEEKNCENKCNNNNEEEEEESDNDKSNNKYLFNKKEPLIDLSKFEKESFDPIGLINPSVYCFMISCLQTLISIPELNYFFMNKLYRKNSKKIKKHKSKKEENEENEEENLEICELYNYFLNAYKENLIKQKKSEMRLPKRLFELCNHLLGGVRMHDAQEFLVRFLESIQEELNTDKKYNIPENITMEQKWIIYRKINNSFIDSIFTGFMRSTVECNKCNNKSIAYDPFIDLSISVNKNKSLDKCLKQFFESEKMDCEYKCEKCQKITKVSLFNT